MAQKSSKKFSYIGENIKKIRQAKRISQADFAAIFNLARPSVGAYEEGRSEPKIETLIQIAKYFRISIDVLLTRELTVNEIYSFDLLKEKLNKAHKIDNVAIDSQGKAQGIPYIEVSNYLNYIVNHSNADFQSDLPRIQVPINKSSSYCAFEMNGSEMEYHQQGLHHGDILIGQSIHLDKTRSALKKIITVVHQENITTRRLDAVSKNEIVLTSDDPNYPKMSIETKNIFQIWKIQSVVSSYLNPPTLMQERMLRIEKEIELLKER
ncbi:MAG: helix-turn-helix domain-containing protein [Cyclobacteriaceae bacterium]|nr:helix-turn-helix domain-containing protein [Cyclobacteriaceae bacterium HetDA_MAG_MS6]